MNTKDNSKICIMIIPHTKKVRKLLMPQWVPGAMILVTCIFFMILSIYFIRVSAYQASLQQDYSDLEQDYSDTTFLVSHLEEDNKSKEIELIDLKSQTEQLHKATNEQLNQKIHEVEAKLIEIDKLQQKLEKMAGIEGSSRGGGISKEVHLDVLEPAEGMDVLKEVLADKETELQGFIKDVEARFEYLGSIPDLMPTSGTRTSNFGNRRDPFGQGIRFHSGVDIANVIGTNVSAAGKGVVIYSGYKGGYGNTIMIDHGYGFKTVYAHNSKILVDTGAKVKKGQVIGKMGNTGRSTGSHLHFEIHKKGQPINPLDILK